MVVIPDQCRPVWAEHWVLHPYKGLDFTYEGVLYPNKGVLYPYKAILHSYKGLDFTYKGVLYPNNWVLHPYKEYSIPLKELRQNVACYPSIMLAFPVMIPNKSLDYELLWLCFIRGTMTEPYPYLVTHIYSSMNHCYWQNTLFESKGCHVVMEYLFYSHR